MGYTRIYGILYFELKRTPLSRYIQFGKVRILSWCRCAIDTGFSTLKSEMYYVNLPQYTLTPTTPIPSYRQQTSNKSPKIATLQADSSHFPGVTLNVINEAITSRICPKNRMITIRL